MVNVKTSQLSCTHMLFGTLFSLWASIYHLAHIYCLLSFLESPAMTSISKRILDSTFWWKSIGLPFNVGVFYFFRPKMFLLISKPNSCLQNLLIRKEERIYERRMYIARRKNLSNIFTVSNFRFGVLSWNLVIFNVLWYFSKISLCIKLYVVLWLFYGILNVKEGYRLSRIYLIFTKKLHMCPEFSIFWVKNHLEFL